jgi:SulP family sulfate permease
MFCLYRPVQDVGLIFLSAMATGVAELGVSKGMETAEIVGTAMLTLTVATTLVGVCTWLVGECVRGGPRHGKG